MKPQNDFWQVRVLDVGYIRDREFGRVSWGRFSMHDPAPPHFVRAQATLLFVEDDAQIHSLLRTALQQSQFEVLSAVTAADALLLAASHSGPIHLLISDLQLPDGSGADVAVQVRKLHPGAGAMFISGGGSGDAQTEEIDPDQIFVLQKPFSVADFLTQVERILKPVLAR